MKLREIYELAVDLGQRYDIRGLQVSKVLENEWKKYNRLSEIDKEFFDQERLHNPYADTRILVGSGEEEVTTAMCGIDLEAPEVILADRLNEKGHGINLLLAHHPEGNAYAALHEVMPVQTDMLEIAGVPVSIAEDIMSSRISEVEKGAMSANHQRAVDAARLLNIPFLCVHSPADNLVQHYLQYVTDNAHCETVEEVLHLLYEIPEYRQARLLKAGPRVVVGENSRRCGKIYIKMTGGTAGSTESYKHLAAAGVGTIIGMHMTDKHRQAAKENHINVIIAGHMASDSLGMNLFIDHLEGAGVNIVPCFGLIRVRRLDELLLH